MKGVMSMEYIIAAVLFIIVATGYIIVVKEKR